MEIAEKNPIDPENKEKEEFPPIEFELHDDKLGHFSMKEKDGGELEVLIENNKKEAVSLNSLLPEGYKIVGNAYRKKIAEETAPEYAKELGNFEDTVAGRKVVCLSQEFADQLGWKQILSALHEIGHSGYAVGHPEEIKIMKRAIESRGEYLRDPGLYRQLVDLKSKCERSAWAAALKNLRLISKKLNLPLENIFSDKNDLRDFVHRRLASYKELYKDKTMQFFDHIPEEEENKILEEIEGLFTRQNYGKYPLGGPEERA